MRSTQLSPLENLPVRWGFGAAGRTWMSGNILTGPCNAPRSIVTLRIALDRAVGQALAEAKTSFRDGLSPGEMTEHFRI